MAEKDEHQHDNEDHKRTIGEDPSKPWETLFDDDRDDQGNLSRVATKKKRQGSSKLTWILAILLILVVLAPIIYVKISGDQSRNGANLSNDRVVIQRNHRRLPKPRRLQWPRHRQRRLSLVKHQALLSNKKNRPVHQRSLASKQVPARLAVHIPFKQAITFIESLSIME